MKAQTHIPMANTPQSLWAQLCWPPPVVSNRPANCFCPCLERVSETLFVCTHHRWVHHCTPTTCDAIGTCPISGVEQISLAEQACPVEEGGRAPGKRKRKMLEVYSARHHTWGVVQQLHKAWTHLYPMDAIPHQIVCLAETMLAQMNQADVTVEATAVDWNSVWQQVILLATDPDGKAVNLSSNLRIPRVNLAHPLKMDREARPFDRHTPRTSKTKATRVRQLTHAFQMHVERVYQRMRDRIDDFNADLQKAASDPGPVELAPSPSYA